MPRVLYLTLIVFFVESNSCQFERKQPTVQYSINENGLHTTKRFNNNGELVSETIYTDSSNGSYFFKKYNDGKIVDSARFINHVIEGIRCQSFSDTLICTNCVHGVENGTTMAYDSQNRLLYKGQLHEGKRVGEWYVYYPDGFPQMYLYYNSRGQLAFFEKLSPERNVLSITGSPVIQTHYDADTIIKGNLFESYWEVARPPVGHVEIEAGIIEAQKIVSPQEIKINYGESNRYYNGEALITIVPSTIGDMQLGVDWKVTTDSDSVLLSGGEVMMLKIIP